MNQNSLGLYVAEKPDEDGTHDFTSTLKRIPKQHAETVRSLVVHLLRRRTPIPTPFLIDRYTRYSPSSTTTVPYTIQTSESARSWSKQ